MMECCPVSGCCLRDPKSVVATVTRVAVGAGLALLGISHLQAIGSFPGMVASGLGFLSFFGMIWGYVLPFLMIVGGILLVWRKHILIGTWCGAVALGSIIVGMLLKPVLSGDPEMLSQAMAAATNALMWLLGVLLSVKMSLSCCCKSKDGGSCCSAEGSCCTK